MGLVRYVVSGIKEKIENRDKVLALVIENPKLGFQLGPLLAKILGVSFCRYNHDGEGEGGLDGGRDSERGGGGRARTAYRCVYSVTTPSDKICEVLPKAQYTFDLRGRFGEYLTEDFEGLSPLETQMEALKLCLNQFLKRP